MCFEGLCIFSNSVCSLLFLFEILDPAWHFWTLLGLCWVLPIWKLRFGSLHSKKASSFKLKQELIEYVAKVDQYIGDLQLEKNIREVLVANDDGDEEEYVL